VHGHGADRVVDPEVQRAVAQITTTPAMAPMKNAPVG
jgi:hypothetical protein